MAFMPRPNPVVTLDGRPVEVVWHDVPDTYTYGTPFHLDNSSQRTQVHINGQVFEEGHPMWESIMQAFRSFADAVVGVGGTIAQSPEFLERLQRAHNDVVAANTAHHQAIREQQRLRAKARNLSLRQRVTEAAPYYAMMKYKLQQWLPFHDCIRDRPGDDGPRLVFSDFLEEQGDCEAATFLRAHSLTLPVDAPEFDIAPRARAWLRATVSRRPSLSRGTLHALMCCTPEELLSIYSFGVPSLMDTQESLEAVGLSLKFSASGWERVKWIDAKLRPAVLRLYPNMEKRNGVS